MSTDEIQMKSQAGSARIHVELTIIRHGNTFESHDTLLRVGARTDLPLVESGHEQARKLGRHFAQTQRFPHRMLCSGLRRTQETAKDILELLIAATPSLERDLQVETWTELNEIDYGPDEGRPEEEVRARVGSAKLEQWEKEGIPPEGWQVNPEALKLQWRRWGKKWHQECIAQVHRVPQARSSHPMQSGPTSQELSSRPVPPYRVFIVTSNGIARFAGSLTGDFERFKTQFGLKMPTGSYSTFVYSDSLAGDETWVCTEWGVRPRV